MVAPTAEIVRRLHGRRPGLPVIGFPRGAGILYREYASATGVDAVGIDAAVPIEWAKAELQTFCPVQGNLDSYLLRAGGSSLDRATKRLLAVLGEGPFIFNLGHGILPDTPPAHVARVADLVRNYRRE